jgi:aldehyde:ferredoxin oxidoreductase
VDLGSGSSEIEEPSDVWYRTYLGGGAAASYYLLKELKPGVDPLSEENLLVFASNIVSGAPISGFSRFTVAAKSPLTGIYGESEAGGFWGPELKFAGFDGIVVRGRADRPVYLWVHDGEVEIRDASSVWGLENGATRERLLEELDDPRARIASIGPAGERLVLFANVINELRHAAGRTGMGAVMGSKNLKAIAVRGKSRLQFANPEGVKEIAKWHNVQIRSHGPNQQMHQYGTPGLLAGLQKSGILPTRNFREGVFAGADRIDGPAMEATILHGRESCYSCAVRCKRVVSCSEPYPVDPAFGGPEYETLASLGSLCCIDDLPAISKGHELCNRLGLDTISVGALIAFAMECFEQGIITEADTGGKPLRFGDPEAMLWLIEEIANRRGVGDVLAHGIRRAAEKIGRGAEELAFHIKGMEIPMHDPRGKTGVGLGFALSPTGADHIEAPHETPFSASGPILDRLAPLGILEPIDPLSLAPDKIRSFLILQRVWSLYNSLGVCNFVAAPLFALSFPKLVEAVNAITGWETSLWELLRAGERALALARMFNIREGLGPGEDRLFRRLHEPLPGGPLEGKSIDPEEFRAAIQICYEMLGWDAGGRPTRGKLADLGLEWID